MKLPKIKLPDIVKEFFVYWILKRLSSEKKTKPQPDPHDPTS